MSIKKLEQLSPEEFKNQLKEYIQTDEFLHEITESPVDVLKSLLSVKFLPEQVYSNLILTEQRALDCLQILKESSFTPSKLFLDLLINSQYPIAIKYFLKNFPTIELSTKDFSQLLNMATINENLHSIINDVFNLYDGRFAKTEFIKVIIKSGIYCDSLLNYITNNKEALDLILDSEKSTRAEYVIHAMKARSKNIIDDFNNLADEQKNFISNFEYELKYNEDDPQFNRLRDSLDGFISQNKESCKVLVVIARGSNYIGFIDAKSFVILNAIERFFYTEEQRGGGYRNYNKKESIQINYDPMMDSEEWDDLVDSLPIINSYDFVIRDVPKNSRFYWKFRINFPNLVDINEIVSDEGLFQSLSKYSNMRHFILKRPLNEIKQIPISWIKNHIKPSQLGGFIVSSMDNNVIDYLYENLTEAFRKKLKSHTSHEIVEKISNTNTKKRSFFAECVGAIESSDSELFLSFANKSPYSLDKFISDTKNSTNIDKRISITSNFINKLPEEEAKNIIFGVNKNYLSHYDEYRLMFNLEEFETYMSRFYESLWDSKVLLKCKDLYGFLLNTNVTSYVKFFYEEFSNKKSEFYLEMTRRYPQEKILDFEELIAEKMKERVKNAGEYVFNEHSEFAIECLRLLTKKEIKENKELYSAMLKGLSFESLYLAQDKNGEYLIEEDYWTSLKSLCSRNNFISTLFTIRKRSHSSFEKIAQIYAKGGPELAKLMGETNFKRVTEDLNLVKKLIKIESIENDEDLESLVIESFTLGKNQEVILEELINKTSLEKIAKIILKNKIQLYVSFSHYGRNCDILLKLINEVPDLCSNTIINGDVDYESSYDSLRQLLENNPMSDKLTFNIKLDNPHYGDNIDYIEEIDPNWTLIPRLAKKPGVKLSNLFALYSTLVKGMNISQTVEVDFSIIGHILDKKGFTPNLINNDIYEVGYENLFDFIKSTDEEDLLKPSFIKYIEEVLKKCPKNEDVIFEEDRYRINQKEKFRIIKDIFERSGVKLFYYGDHSEDRINSTRFSSEAVHVVINTLNRQGINFDSIDISSLEITEKIEVIKYIEENIDPRFKTLGLLEKNLDDFELLYNYNKFKDLIPSKNDNEQLYNILLIPNGLRNNKKIIKSLNDLLALKGLSLLQKIDSFKNAINFISKDVKIDAYDFFDFSKPEDISVLQEFDDINFNAISDLTEMYAKYPFVKFCYNKNKKDTLRFLRSIDDISTLKDSFEMYRTTLNGIESLENALKEAQTDEEREQIKGTISNVTSWIEEIIHMDNIDHIHDRLSITSSFVKSNPLVELKQSHLININKKNQIFKETNFSLFFPKTVGELTLLGDHGGWCVNRVSSYADGVILNKEILVGLCPDENPSIENSEYLAHLKMSKPGDVTTYYCTQIKGKNNSDASRINIDAITAKIIHFLSVQK